MAAEVVTVRLNEKESGILDRYQNLIPPLSRGGCLQMLLHDWERVNGGMRTREELDREIQQRALTLVPGGWSSTASVNWATLAALLWAQDRELGWAGAIEKARIVVAEVNEAKEKTA